LADGLSGTTSSSVGRPVDGVVGVKTEKHIPLRRVCLPRVAD
jgi:hypothetical protein